MDQVEEIKQKTDVVSLVGERVKLARAGRNFKALCPFHSERTPSFMVSPELQIFKCFGCGKSGDVFTFLQEFEGMEFPEALGLLAKRAGIELIPLRKDGAFRKKERLREINHLASEFYHYLLTSHAVGKKALHYVYERGIRNKTIETFKLGFAADSWDALIRYLSGKKRYLMQELEEVGLVVRSRGKTYDRFRNRVIFPLRDTQGYIVGFSGRVLPGGEEGGGKYINSPETELYHKSQHLYGLYENRSFIKKKDQVIVVEGELDVLSSWQAGVKQVVAVKGTAMTKQQVELLRRYTRNINLALDADTAGDAATKRSIAIADTAEMNINVVLLLGGKDPDEISQSNPKQWRKVTDRALSVYDFYLSSCKKRFDLTSGIGKKQATEEIIPVLGGITNAVEQAHYIRKFAKILDVTEDVVVDEIKRYERKQRLGDLRKDRNEEEVGEEKSREEILDEYLLALLLQGGIESLEREKFSPEVVGHPGVRRIVKLLVKAEGKGFDVGSFVQSLPTELQELAENAYLSDLNISQDREKLKSEIKLVLEELRRFRLRQELDRLSDEIGKLEGHSKQSAAEEEELANLRKTFVEIARKLSD